LGTMKMMTTRDENPARRSSNVERCTVVNYPLTYPLMRLLLFLTRYTNAKRCLGLGSRDHIVYREQPVYV
jgi:hypothetical protein